MKKTLAKYFLLILLPALAGCIEEFDAETEREAGILVINGRITNAPGPHQITISRTAEGNRVSVPEGGAEVTLIDDQGNQFDFFQEVPGRYVLPESYATIYTGVSYKIQVRLGDQLYESPLTRMNQTLSEDEISYRFEDESIINSNGIEVTNTKYNVYLRSTTPFIDQKQYFKWEANEVFVVPPMFAPDDPPCYLTNRIDPQRVVIGESVDGRELILDDVLLASKFIDDAFRIKQWTLVSQFNIPEDEYIYWKKVRTSIEQVGSIFDIPPATIIGNISNTNNPDEIVYGYFSVAAEKTVRFSLLRADAPADLPLRCSGRFANRPPWCFCEGGIARPDYF